MVVKACVDSFLLFSVFASWGKSKSFLQRIVFYFYKKINRDLTVQRWVTESLSLPSHAPPLAAFPYFLSL